MHSLSKVPYEQHSFVFKQLNTSIEKLISLVEIKDTTNDEPNTIVLSLRSQVSQLQEQLSTKSSELGILKDAQNFGQVFANNSIAKDFQVGICTKAVWFKLILNNLVVPRLLLN